MVGEKHSNRTTASMSTIPKFGVPAVPGIWRVAVGGDEETQVLEKGTQARWVLLADGICLLDPDITTPVIEFFSFATRKLAPIASLSREVMPPGGLGGNSLAVSPMGDGFFMSRLI